MGFYITNISGMRARNNLTRVNSEIDKTMQRLSTGLRINSAKDDPAGLAISDRMTSEINGLRQGQRNAADGQALAQTVEGSLDEINSMLQDLRTIAVQYANGVNTDGDREALQAQADVLSEEITRIATGTKYGGKTILDGNSGTSLYNGGKLTLQIGAYGSDTVTLDMTQSFKLNDIFATIKNGTTTYDNLVDATGHLDMGHDKVLDGIDAMIALVDNKRGELGAFQNRLDATMRSQDNIIANMSDARSRIMDTDFAAESARLAQQNILQQASMMMLLNAQNSHANMILKLLGAQ